MDSILIDGWLADAESTPTLDEASVVVLQGRVRAEGAGLGFTDAGLGSIVNVASELAHNQLAHARGGRIALRRIERDGVAGLEIIAADRGPGIASPTAALRGAPPPTDSRTRQSLGVGLAATMELADELDFDVRIAEGTCVWARKFARPVRRRKCVGIFGRPYPGEHESGDDGAFVRNADDLLVAVADGLGHGEPAREASLAAMAAIRAGDAHDIEHIVQDCHAALHETRGAVLAIARVSDVPAAIHAAVLGDANLQVEGPGTHRRVSGRPFILGARGQRPKTVVEDVLLGARDLVLLFTDGISSRADLNADLDLLREHPIVVAHQVVERFARENDDALVCVVG